MRRYQIVRRDLSFDQSLSLYRLLVRWAATHADRFVLGIDTRAYDRTSNIERFTTFGTTQLGAADPTFVRVTGKPNERLIDALTHGSAPPAAKTGNESPVEEITMYSGDRALYVSYDYGTVQTLDLESREVDNLTDLLNANGFSDRLLLPLKS